MKAKTWTQEVDEGLLQAVVEGALDRVKLYADKGADLYQTDPEGRKNPLRLAAIRSHLHVVKYLVEERGVQPSKDGRVLHMTVMAGDHLKEIFTYLVSKGANINGIDPTLGTPLMLSIREGADFKLTRWLVEQGADVTVVTPTGTALHNACEYGDLPIIEFLLKHGGDKLFTAADARGFTPLTVAAYHRRDDVVKYLVQIWKADVNFKADVNPLFMAVQNDAIQTVSLLLSLGADPNVCQEEKQAYPLHLAASNNFLDVVELLINAKGEVDCKGHIGYTPLFMAASEGYTECVRKLLQKGADIHYRSSEDYTTAIYHAVRANRTPTVRLLLENGADPTTTRTEENQSLAEYARAKKWERLANLLESWQNASSAEERKKICFTCNKLVDNMKKCGRCKVRWYCSADCQKEDWQKHKLNCKPQTEQQ
eukprot:TRINITY_DN7205_c0_g1_i1.p1 TRINITY_DN7205_c0_g1~~TRINITY_DN7205_c0_g1_i1.p1  ORF type:complete len:425 (+),score=96.34 TRINITY_DN7205_c0_g1_i1:65-1339(+)